jgi:hypothetical protein
MLVNHLTNLRWFGHQELELALPLAESLVLYNYLGGRSQGALGAKDRLAQRSYRRIGPIHCSYRCAPGPSGPLGEGLPGNVYDPGSDHDRLAGMRYGPLRYAHNGQGRGGLIGIEALDVLSGTVLYPDEEQCHDRREPSQTVEGTLKSSHLRHSS